jgi:hypothetical protein
MATGIRQSTCITDYVTATCDLIQRWEKLNYVQRAQTLTRAAQVQLNKYSIPVAEFCWGLNLGTALGLFNYQLWLVEILENNWHRKITKGKEDAFKEGVAKLADTIYHEYRHCEQWFRMARWLASGKWTPAQIAETMRIPLEIAQAAAAGTRGQLSAEEQSEAELWYKSVYAKAAEQKKFSQGTGVTNLNARDVILGPGQLKPTKGANPLTAEISQMRQEAQYQQYRDLSEEDDAHAVGKAVQEGIYSKMGLLGAYAAPVHLNVSKQ